METKQTRREQTSALIDGELSTSQAGLLLDADEQTALRADWDLYHCIGDVLRSEDMPAVLSKEFAARFAARLDAEPTIIAPALAADSATRRATKEVAFAPGKSWALAGAAAVFVAVVATFSAPQMMMAWQGETAMPASVAAVPVALNSADEIQSTRGDTPMLRDPRIDEYLLAHQRFAPSMYNSAHYVRSAIQASESTK